MFNTQIYTTMNNSNNILVNDQNNVLNQNTVENIDWDGTLWRDRVFSHPERTITIGTSCSGIGAPEQALRQLGLNSKILFAGDIDPNVKKSYFANYDITEEQWHTDMFKFDATPFKGKLTLFVSGICCQTFSKAGGLAGVKDKKRGCLYTAFSRIVRECEPEVWIMENVENMLNSNKGSDWKIIKEELDTLGYDIHYQVLNSKNYGVPQSRARLFVIGFKRPTEFLYPKPIKQEKVIYDILEDTEQGLRQLTPRETLRLQGFGEDFKIAVSDTYAYKQAGNSIAVPVLKALYQQMDITKYGF